MKLYRSLLILLVIVTFVQSRRSRMSIGRGSRFSSLSKIGQGIGRGLKDLLDTNDDE